MTTKMILIPIDRLKALEKLTTDTPVIAPDVEFKLLQQAKSMRSRPRQQLNKQEISIENSIKAMEQPQKDRVRRTVKHMKAHDGNLNYDKHTGEIQYDGVKAIDSDVRELLSTLTSKKKRRTTPRGWNLFMQSLNDTEAPADVHLGWKWEKGVDKGDWSALQDG